MSRPEVIAENQLTVLTTAVHPTQPRLVLRKRAQFPRKETHLTLLLRIPKQRSNPFHKSRGEIVQYLDASQGCKYQGGAAGGATVFLKRHGSRYISPGELHRPRVCAHIGQVL